VRRDTQIPATLEQKQIDEIAAMAWRVRERAHLVGRTGVGCAILANDGNVYLGCNVEHPFRCHDIHAEVNAISSMVANGAKNLVILIIAAERDRFTPCGGCMDWIMLFATTNSLVGFQGQVGGPIIYHSPQELMPLYPK
jgi:cytidine deaminase